MDPTQIITIVVIALLALALGYLAGQLTAKPAKAPGFADAMPRRPMSGHVRSRIGEP